MFITFEIKTIRLKAQNRKMTKIKKIYRQITVSSKFKAIKDSQRKINSAN